MNEKSIEGKIEEVSVKEIDTKLGKKEMLFVTMAGDIYSSFIKGKLVGLKLKEGMHATIEYEENTSKGKTYFNIKEISVTETPLSNKGTTPVTSKTHSVSKVEKGGREDYWERREKRDAQTQKMITRSAAQDRASQIVSALIQVKHSDTLNNVKKAILEYTYFFEKNNLAVLETQEDKDVEAFLE